MAAAKAENEEGENGIPLPSQLRKLTKKFWEWAKRKVAERDAQVYMAANFKMDN